MKKILGTYTNNRSHWVGDGFPVRTLFSHSAVGSGLSPFLMLDYAGPERFAPTSARRGVGQHLHRGFETVTIVYQGELEHRDSSGGGGLIGPGDVQWMTAGSGILHEEFHSPAFAKNGGTLEMVQLWVNLPAREKMVPPRYQTLHDGAIPSVELPGGAGRVRVIAGSYGGQKGPALTYTPLDVWDVRLVGARSADFRLPAGRSLALVVLSGQVLVNGEESVNASQVVVFGREETDVRIEAVNDATVLLLSGEPIDEPVVAYGPFVMNSAEEISQAVRDFNSGRFGEARPAAKQTSDAPSPR
ncbi:pirin family protein [Caballeronia ptereochthonis]|uniref:Pirin family protein n=1 Tax=Caballeronia ptereochthonis TaxID=1777144 RepID=A0A158C2C3_9BURK|nr:pirin family protein [Caballeronia ptereochthonis]SAK76463.1 pirin family protein [Caballeronia ptereochthonis]